MSVNVKPCPGCPACTTGDLPQFATDDEEEEFWDQHKPSQFIARFKVAKFTQRGRKPAEVKREKVTLMLLPSVKASLRTLATHKNIGYQTLVQQFLEQRVHRELDLVAERSLLITRTANSPDWTALASIDGCQILAELSDGKKCLVGTTAVDVVQVIIDITALHFRVESARAATYPGYDVEEAGGPACRRAQLTLKAATEHL